jgi:lipoprotein-anchoring transpeptidase ErfK/SrfK
MRPEHKLQMVKLAAAMLVALVQVEAQMKTAAKPAPKPARTQETRRIVVSLTDHKLVLFDGDRAVKTYETASGKPTTPTPAGQFEVVSKVANPVYKAHGQNVAPGPRNPVGTRWIGLSLKGYGIHGTNEPKSIGKNSSHGCIRMRNKDVEELFELVSVGVPVELVGGPLPAPSRRTPPPDSAATQSSL